MAEEMQQQQDMYEGKVKATIKEATADQVWPLLADFCGIHRWMPSVETRLDVGVAGEIGCVRHCATKDLSPVNGESVGWARERLTSIDHASRKLSYVVVDNNIGWRHYKAEWEVVDEEDAGGCRVEWSFRMEPDEEWGEKPLGPLVASALETIARAINEEFLARDDGGQGRYAVDERQ
ncbi:lachrymatory-factor synthase-like [Nymphaea colorata]|uniref:Coenzyme Q-binding protein COQ10 START domain-containing protein n=1 Tax=Nymphaea colorata TaxID=210225 RepID=A0A5K1E476_9MAGN|nr:lachrymatory-factor synthase-like [Nymphaea colorata]